MGSNVLIPPVFIDESSRVENSIIGPNVSIGMNCTIHGSRVRNAIIDDDSASPMFILGEFLAWQRLSGEGYADQVGDRRR